MRTMTIAALLATSAAPASPRFFEKEVAFWDAPRKKPARAPTWMEGETVPPGPARDLLERPTAENARAYLEWQQERLERLQRALEALEAVSSEGAPASGAILFTRDECPWSRAQEEELRGLPLAVVRHGTSPELWTRHGVTATPTLVVNGRVFRGFTERAVVESAMRAGGRP